MTLFRSPLERRLWLAAGGLVVAIFLALPFVRTLSDALREAGVLREVMIGAFAVVVAIVAWLLARTRPSWREVAVLVPFAGFYVAVLAMMERPEEAFHFVEYGAVGALVYGAVAARRRAGKRTEAEGPRLRELMIPAAGATLLTALIGWADEGVQHLVPERYYDLRDIGFNALAGVLAAGALTALRLVRRRSGPPRRRGR